MSAPRRIAAAGLIALGAFGLGGAPAHGGDDWVVDKTYGKNGATDEAPFYASGLTPFGEDEVVVTGALTDAFGKYDSIGASRLDRDGSLDLEFGQDGWVFFGPNNYNAYDQAVTADQKGRILIAGSGTGYLAGLKAGPELVRLNSDGTRDRTFRRQTAFGFPGFGYSDVASLASGKVLVVGGGESISSAKRPTIQIRRFNENGKPDRSFGERGKVIIKGPRRFTGRRTTGATNLHLLEGGDFLVSGVYADKPWVGRFHPDGGRKRSFGGNGFVTADIRQNPGCGVILSCTARGLVVTEGGAIRMLAHEARGRGDTPYVVGFTKNGRIDRRYGVGGRARVLPNKFRLGTPDLIGLPDGSALVTYPSISRGVLVRVSPNGKRTSHFKPLRKGTDWVITGEYANGYLFLSGGKGEKGVVWKLRQR